MSEDADPTRFSEWLRGPSADQSGPLPRGFGSLKTLIADAMAFADDRAQRSAGDTEDSLACRAGCHWCCHLPVEATVAEVMTALDYALTHYSETALETLRERARSAARRYRTYPSQRPGESGSVPCPFLTGTRCGVYPARPLTCRGWNSYDANACESAYRKGPDEVVVPVNQRRRMDHASTGKRLAQAFLEQGLPGHVYLGAVLYELMSHESLPMFAECWLDGEIQLDQTHIA